MSEVSLKTICFGGVSLQTTKTIRTKGFGKQGKVINKIIDETGVKIEVIPT